MNRRERPKTINLEFYLEKMGFSLPDKELRVLPHVITLPPNSRILSIGAGSGILEKTLTTHRPDINLTAIDNDFIMAQETESNDTNDQVFTVLADATKPPFPNERFELIIASSVNHEIASFADNYSFADEFDDYLLAMLKLLKPGGKFFIRDFAGPDEPQKKVELLVGHKEDGDPMEPVTFLNKFATKFKGLDTNQLQKQLTELQNKDQFKPGSVIKINQELAYELLLHLSWSLNFDHEIIERYSYLGNEQYAKKIQQVATEAEISTQLVERYDYTQAGYVDHVSGRLDLIDEEKNKLPFIPTTQVVVIERIQKRP